jgi:hypothetical protein
MSLQELIVYLILFLTVAWVVYRIVARFRRRDADPCNGCSTVCGPCQLRDLKKEIDHQKRSRL